MIHWRWLQLSFIVSLLLTFTSASPVMAQSSATPAVTLSSNPVEFVWASGGGPALPLDQPTSVALDPRGNLWVLDGQHGRFQIFAPDGAFLEAWGEPGSEEGQFNFVRGDGYALGALRFDSAGNFYVADTGNLRVQKFDANREFVTAWGTYGAKDGQFLDPIGLGLGPDGRIYVTDDGRMDVQVFDADGAFLFRIGGPGGGDGSFTDIAGGVAVAPDGSILTGDWGDNLVQRYTPDGTFLTAWGGEGSGKGQFQGPTGIAVDDQGQVYVADAYNHRVQVFTPDGAFLTSWGAEGDGEGQFVEPVSVALDGEGHVYVSEYASDRVQKFRLPAPLAPTGTPTA